MARRVLRSRSQTARKTYRCDYSSLWINSGYTLADCDTDEQRAIIQKAELDDFKILPGQQYLTISVIEDGLGFINWRARPDMYEVCEQLDLFDQD